MPHALIILSLFLEAARAPQPALASLEITPETSSPPDHPKHIDPVQLIEQMNRLLCCSDFFSDQNNHELFF